MGEAVLHRPRLYARLAGALDSRVTLVAGDAGFGKTTLLAGFLSTAARPTLWYRLDPADSDPGVFAAYVLDRSFPRPGPPGSSRPAGR
jgi:LuxR family maltose regulon positive regulatory protein